MKLSTQLQTRTQTRLAPILSAAAGAAALIVVAAILLTTQSPEPLSGIVNDYARVTAVGTYTLTLDDASAFSPGDKVLVIQMKGATISQVDDSTYGNIVGFGEAGNYEIGKVAQVSGTQLTLERRLCRVYTPADVVQAVRIPVYTEAIVTGTLSAPAWDGHTGGILVVEATDRLTLAAGVDLTGRGFRGGDRNGQATAGGLTYICPFNSGRGGIKGEGITELPQAACRGKLANGGGGGNDHNGGGGGGGNYGAGGVGGHGWKSNSLSNLSDLDKGGRGGVNLQDYYDSGLPKLFLGGGGGGGHQNNGASYPAGNGGGIVILISPILEVAQPVSILAAGVDALDHQINDGAGGGGGGGSILLDVGQVLSPASLTLDVSGGDGATIHTRDQHGPGGGGGGGVINSTSPLPAGVTRVLAGGEPGYFITTNQANPLGGTSHGATAGRPGGVITNLVLQTCSEPPFLDLDKLDGGEDYFTSYTTNTLPVPLAEAQRSDIADLDDTHMTLATITLTNPVDGSGESLELLTDSASLAALGLTWHRAANGHSASLTGHAPISHYLQAFAQIGYHHTTPNPSLVDRLIAFEVNDGGATSNTAFTHIALSAGTFPVEWLGFEAMESAGDALLGWITASEMNSAYFEVERSTDGRQFAGIGQVPAQGTTSELSSYEYRDAGAARLGAARLYYRLRQVDMDGSFEYSATVELALANPTGGLALSIAPNPVTGEARVRLTGPTGRRVMLHLISLDGRTIWAQPLETGQMGEVSYRLDASQLAPGIYHLQASDGQQAVTEKVVVQ